jgi:hypothetical protein
MNKSTLEHFDSVTMGFNWSDIVYRQGTTPSPLPASARLASRILQCILPPQCLRSSTPVDGAEPDVDAVPASTALRANVPNPFNPTTSVPFDLARAGRVQLVVFDVSGRRVRTLVDAEFPAGRHQQVWDGFDDAGGRVASGVYVVRMQTGGFVASRRIVVLR